MSHGLSGLRGGGILLGMTAVILLASPAHSHDTNALTTSAVDRCYVGNTGQTYNFYDNQGPSHRTWALSWSLQLSAISNQFQFFKWGIGLWDNGISGEVGKDWGEGYKWFFGAPTWKGTITGHAQGSIDARVQVVNHDDEFACLLTRGAARYWTDS